MSATENARSRGIEIHVLLTFWVSASMREVCICFAALTQSCLHHKDWMLLCGSRAIASCVWLQGAFICCVRRCAQPAHIMHT